MAIKTLHITNSYHPTSGGIELFYHALLDAANRHKRFVRLVVPGADIHRKLEIRRIYHVKAPYVPILDSRYRWMLPHVYAWPYDSPLRQILAAERPDLVEVCDKFWLLYLSGALRRQWIPGVPVPVIVGLTCERLDDNMRSYVSGGWASQRVCERYMRTCYVPRFDFHVAASDYIAIEVRRLLPERLRDRLRVCPMGPFRDVRRSAEWVRRRQELLRRAGGDGRTVLLFMPADCQRRKICHCCRVCGKLAGRARSDYRLIIAGDAVREATGFAGELAPTQLVLGHFQRQDLRELYPAADIFIHPNLASHSALRPEAMAAGGAGRSASGGVLTYANTGNAWLAENTAEAFAVAIRSVRRQ
jgi:glycosyltransferase involved in cell wall biosynthesis